MRYTLRVAIDHDLTGELGWIPEHAGPGYWPTTDPLLLAHDLLEHTSLRDVEDEARAMGAIYYGRFENGYVSPYRGHESSRKVLDKTQGVVYTRAGNYPGPSDFGTLATIIGTKMQKSRVSIRRSWSLESITVTTGAAGLARLVTIARKEHEYLRKTYKYIAGEAGCTPVTVSNLLRRKTRFPRYSTVIGVLTAVGFSVTCHPNKT